MRKVYPTAAAALEGIVRDGQLLAVGGFGTPFSSSRRTR